jgi:hypothetical protein
MTYSYVSFILVLLRYLLIFLFIFSSRFYKRSAEFVLDNSQFWTAVSIKYGRLEFINNKCQWQCALVCVSTLHQEIQVPHFTESTPQVWVWERAIISLSPLLLHGKAEGTHAATHTPYSWHKHISKIGFQDWISHTVLWILLRGRDLNGSFDHLTVSSMALLMD